MNVDDIIMMMMQLTKRISSLFKNAFNEFASSSNFLVASSNNINFKFQSGTVRFPSHCPVLYCCCWKISWTIFCPFFSVSLGHNNGPPILLIAMNFIWANGGIELIWERYAMPTISFCWQKPKHRGVEKKNSKTQNFFSVVPHRMRHREKKHTVG